MARYLNAISLVISGMAVSISGISFLILSTGGNGSRWTFFSGTSLIIVGSLISAAGGFLAGRQPTIRIAP